MLQGCRMPDIRSVRRSVMRWVRSWVFSRVQGGAGGNERLCRTQARTLYMDWQEMISKLQCEQDARCRWTTQASRFPTHTADQIQIEVIPHVHQTKHQSQIRLERKAGSENVDFWVTDRDKVGDEVPRPGISALSSLHEVSVLQSLNAAIDKMRGG